MLRLAVLQNVTSFGPMVWGQLEGQWVPIGMDDLPVTLIVKAPNQQVADQTVQCEPNWTIRRLKGHLEEVYPCKPKSEEQKLIYSGRLLSDTVVLKDVLRKFEGQDTHTVHLVCTPPQVKYGKGYPTKKTKTETPDAREASSSTRPNPPEPPVEEVSNAEGLRRRNFQDTSLIFTIENRNGNENNNDSNSTDPSNSYPYGMYPQPPYYWNQELANAWNTQISQWAASGLNTYQQSGANYTPIPNMTMPPNMDPMMFATQIAWMQQLRMQHLQQYYSMSGMSPPPNYPVNQQMMGAMSNQTHDLANEQENVIQPARREEPANNDVPNEGEHRDWLEWMYNLGRWFLLISVAYFYSNPLRFCFVLFMGMAIYFLQVRYNEAQNERPQNIADNINNNYRQPQDNNNDRAQNNVAADADNTVAENREDPQTVNNNQPANEDSYLMLAWTAVTSFFSSLIPEVPNGRN